MSVVLVMFVLTPLAEAFAASASSVTRRFVVMFYANETSERAFSSEHYKELMRILEGSKGSLAKTLRADLEADARDFPDSVARNTNALLAQARQSFFDLAVFTNQMALEKKYKFYHAAQKREEELNLPSTREPLPTHPFLTTAPLSSSEMLRAALIEVLGQYPAQPVDLVLLVYSHGTLDMALMPRANIDLRVTGEDEVRNALEQEASATPPIWARLQGTRKSTFWRILHEVSKANPQVRFPLVVMAACQSVVMSWEDYLEIPDSVTLIGHTGLGSPSLKSTRLDKVFENVNSASEFSLAEGARAGGYRVDSRASLLLWLVPITLWQVPLVLYFAPLVLWIVWFACDVGPRARGEASRDISSRD